MSKCYTGSGPSASGTANKTALTVISTTAVRPMVNEVIVGVNLTPADVVLLAACTRFTAAGTSAGSAPTPQALDPGDVAATCTLGWTHSAEPTYAASVDLLQIPLNQRATFRWVAQDGRELVAPATASNGVGTRLVSAGSSVPLNATVMWRE